MNSSDNSPSNPCQFPSTPSNDDGMVSYPTDEQDRSVHTAETSLNDSSTFLSENNASDQSDNPNFYQNNLDSGSNSNFTFASTSDNQFKDSNFPNNTRHRFSTGIDTEQLNRRTTVQSNLSSIIFGNKIPHYSELNAIMGSRYTSNQDFSNRQEIHDDANGLSLKHRFSRTNISYNDSPNEFYSSQFYSEDRKYVSELEQKSIDNETIKCDKDSNILPNNPSELIVETQKGLSVQNNYYDREYHQDIFPQQPPHQQFVEPLPSSQSTYIDDDVTQRIDDKNYSYLDKSDEISDNKDLEMQMTNDLENIVVVSCKNILLNSSEFILQSAELANTLCGQVGRDTMSLIRARCGGFLALLERYPSIFIVHRIATNATVSLTPYHISLAGDLLNNSNNSNNLLFPSQKSQLGGVDAGMVSHSLHIGNVPSSVGEAQIRLEFEYFGPVENVHIFTQRNHRFAFVSYFHLEDAIRAQYELSRKHLWKGAISFAKKTKPGRYSNNNNNNNNNNKNISIKSNELDAYSRYNKPMDLIGQQLGQLPFNRLNIADNMGSISPSGYLPGANTTRAYPQINHHQQHHHHQQQLSGRDVDVYQQPRDWPKDSYSNFLNKYANTADTRQQVQQHKPSSSPPPPSSSSSSNNNYFTHPYPHPNKSMHSSSSSYQPMISSSGHDNNISFLQRPSYSHMIHPNITESSGSSSSNSSRRTRESDQLTGGLFIREPTAPLPPAPQLPGAALATGIIPSRGNPTLSQDRNYSQQQQLFQRYAHNEVLRKLCDEDYAPTQYWIADPIADRPYIKAIISTLLELGQSASIGRLLESLRVHPLILGTLKSNPLKAFLSSYPQYFEFDGNIVSVRLQGCFEDLF